MRFLIVSEDTIYSHHITSLLHEDGHVADIQGQSLIPGVGINAYFNDYPISGVILDLQYVAEDQVCRIYAEWERVCGTDICILPITNVLALSLRLLNYGALGVHESFNDSRLLCARLYALVRRRQGIYSDVICLNSLKINMVTKRVSFDGFDLMLTPFEYRIMEELIRNRERVLRRDEILLTMFHDCPVNERTRSLEVVIGRLRKKICQFFDRKNGGIEVTRSIGYRFVGLPKASISNKRGRIKKTRLNSFGSKAAIRIGWRWFL